MSLAPGSRLGHYEVVGKLGEGGMGEVWRATDTRLGRAVALKLLPEDFALDPERHARFEREAKVLASLSHPNIAVLYGLEHLPAGDERWAMGESSHTRQAPASGIPSPEPRAPSPGVERAGGALHVLVMELVEGEDLARRLASGPLPVDEALAIALQVASALEAAHEKGIVHRDLKPANVAVTPDGTVKVLDFGLAKAWEADAAGSNPSLSPTITSRHTREGVILGTAAYMSPEQARGKPVDRRTDIWAFGCLVYEMLTGAQTFAGDTVTDVIAAVVTRDPDWDALPAGTPAAARQLLARCLRKDPRTRQPDIASVRFELSELAIAHPAEAPVATAAAASAPARRARPALAWLGAGAALLVLGATAGWLAAPRPADPRVVEFELQSPTGTAFYLDPERPGAAVVSPDGEAVAFTAEAKGVVQLYVRPLASAAARPVPGTDGAQYPFWSPDSRSVGYFAAGKLRKVQVMGSASPPVTICDAEEVKGASWGSAGVIVFAPNASSVLMRVPDAGGTPAATTQFDKALNEESHRHPRFLPDGRHFLYLARVNGGSNENGVMVGSIDGGAGTLLLRSPAAAQYASGRLLFLREGTLMAQPFDPSRLRLSGEAAPVADGVSLVSNATALAVFSASDDGVLLYQSGGTTATRKLVWRDREGRVTGSLGDDAVYYDVSLSPQGDQAAVTVAGTSGAGDVWVYDIARAVRTRLTFDPRDEWRVVWSPDGRTLAFASDRAGHYDLYTLAVGGAQPEQLLYASDNVKVPCSISPDGRTLLYQEQSRETGWDIYAIPLVGEPTPRPFIGAASDQGLASFSPDGRWVAYSSNESGHLEVYVAPFPGPGRKWQISTRGGYWPSWRTDGREITYLDTSGTITTVPVETRGDALSAGMPQPAFLMQPPETNNSRFTVSGDGSRFLAIEPVQALIRPPLTVVVNWTARLAK
jgi:Tol biopolymer transport system component